MPLINYEVKMCTYVVIYIHVVSKKNRCLYYSAQNVAMKMSVIQYVAFSFIY